MKFRIVVKDDTTVHVFHPPDPNQEHITEEEGVMIADWCRENKCVTIVAYPNSNMARTHRLSLNEFCWRNWDFDAAATAKRNSDEMMYL